MSERGLHVVLLNQAFHPDVVATAQMSKDLADHLVRSGHRVTAVASRSVYGKQGAVLPKREAVGVEGSDRTIEVCRVGSSVFGKAGYLARVADFGLWYLLAGWRVLTLQKPDVIVSFTTPPFVAGVGIVSRWLRGSKAVYWVMDLYPDLPVACGVMKAKSPVTKFFEGVNRFLLKHSDADVVLGRCMRDRVLDKGVKADKIELIPVWAIDTDLEPTSSSAYRQEWGLGDETVVMYSGNFGIGHDATTICGAMEALKHNNDIRFEFVGGGKRRDEVETFIAAREVTNAQWHDYAPRERLGESLSVGDIHLVSLREGVEGIMVPSKLYGILAVERPAIFIGNPTSEIARVLLEHDCGLVVREGDVEGLVAAIEELAGDPQRRRAMGRRGREAVLNVFDRASACDKWLEVIERVGGFQRTEPAPERETVGAGSGGA